MKICVLLNTNGYRTIKKANFGVFQSLVCILQTKILNVEQNIQDFLFKKERWKEIKIMKYHLLFEQSGTFKNVIKEKGLEAYDYDILNNFGETDYQMDLFKQIELEFDNLMNGKHNETIFGKMNKDKDFIIAFFPCTYFCQANSLIFRLWNGGKKLDFDKKNIKRLIKRNNERAYFFELYMKFCFICKQLGFKTIIENPSASGGGDWLVNYSPIELSYHEKDRTLWGDVFKKPTNFFAINFDMKEKLMLYTKVLTNQTILSSQGMTERSMISKLYAENFYKRFLEELEVKEE